MKLSDAFEREILRDDSLFGAFAAMAMLLVCALIAIPLAPIWLPWLVVTKFRRVWKTWREDDA